MLKSNEVEFLIVGGGLSGLLLALHLQARGRSFLLLESASMPGGRVSSEQFRGYTLDRGFQVMLDSYDQGLPYLSLAELGLGYFDSGAYLQGPEGRAYVGDPLKNPASIPDILAHYPFSMRETWQLLWLTLSLWRRSDASIWGDPESSTRAYLDNRGFDKAGLDRFLQPFFGGVFLDDNLEVSSRLFCFLYKRFALGRAGLPRDGMSAIPAQLAKQIDPGSILCSQRVESIHGQEARVVGGSSFHAREMVIALDKPSASQLLGWTEPSKSRETRVYYYETDACPLSRPALCLNATGKGTIRHISFPSSAQPSYAPVGRHLVSVTTKNQADGKASQLDPDCLLNEVGEIFRLDAQHWSFLRSYHVSHGLPVMPSMPGPGFLHHADHTWLVGDYLTYPSINGAFESANKLANHLLGLSPCGVEASW